MPSSKTGVCANPECPQGGEDVWLKGRGLCRACYNRKFREGTLDRFRPGAGAGSDSQAEDGRPVATTNTPEGSCPGHDCASEETKPTHEAAKTERSSMDPNKKTAKKPARPKASGDFIVHIDFTPAAHLLEELQRRANEQMRPLPMQVLWELKQASSVEAA